VSRVAAIYQGLKGEGDDPHEESFYQELDPRIARALPHRKAKTPPPRPTTSPVRASSRTSGKGKETGFTDKHKAIMEKYLFGDPDNLEDRAAFLEHYKGGSL